VIIISLQVHLIVQGYLKPRLYKHKCSDDSVSEEEMDLFVPFSGQHNGRWTLWTFHSHSGLIPHLQIICCKQHSWFE